VSRLEYESDEGWVESCLPWRELPEPRRVATVREHVAKVPPGMGVVRYRAFEDDGLASWEIVRA
jgi:hypothetical protein